ncbi:MAG: hypothetical protein RR532_03195, partial [Erysipelothrix sp.]
MKKLSKKFLSLALSIAIGMGTITASYASTEIKDYGNEFLKINVKETYSQDNTEGKLDIDLVPKDKRVSIDSITYPDESKTIDKDKKLQPKPEKVTKDHKYSYEVNENGEYEFLVKYKVETVIEDVTKEKKIESKDESGKVIETVEDQNKIEKSKDKETDVVTSEKKNDPIVREEEVRFKYEVSRIELPDQKKEISNSQKEGVQKNLKEESDKNGDRSINNENLSSTSSSKLSISSQVNNQNEPINLEIPKKDTNPIAKISFTVGIQENIVRSPKLIIDYSGTDFVIVDNGISGSGNVDFANSKNDYENKIIEVPIKDNILDGTATVNLSVRFTKLIDAGRSSSMKATFSGLDKDNNPYSQVTVNSPQISSIGEKSNEYVRATPEALVGNYTITPKQSVSLKPGTPYYWMQGVSLTANSDSILPLYFEDFKLVRRVKEGSHPDKYYSNNLNGGISGRQALQKTVINENGDFVSYFGEIVVNSVAFKTDFLYQDNTEAGLNLFDYEVYNGDTLIYKYEQSIIITHGTNISETYGLNTTVKIPTDGIAAMSLSQKFESAPSTQYIKKGGYTEIKFDKSKVRLMEVHNVGEMRFTNIYVGINGYYRKYEDIDFESETEIDSIKLELSRNMSNYNPGYGNHVFVFENVGLGEGEEYSLNVTSDYSNSNGDKITPFRYVGPKFIGVQSNDKRDVPEATAVLERSHGFANAFPTIPVTNVNFSPRIALYSTPNTPVINKPYAYVIVPKEISVIQEPSYRSGIGRTVGQLDTTFRPSGTSQYDWIDFKETINLQKESYDDDHDIYYSIANGSINSGNLSNRYFSEVFQFMVNFQSNSMLSGTHEIKYGTGSLTLEDLNLTGGYSTDEFTKKNIDPKVKNILGATSNVVYETTNNVIIERTTNIGITSRSKGSVDTEWAEGAEVSNSIIGGNVEYNYVVSNPSQTRFDAIEVITTLPNVNDQYIISGNPRNSQFKVNYGNSAVRATLNGKPTSINVEYSLSQNPPRFDAGGNPVTGEGDWVASVNQDDRALIRAVRITLGNGVKFNPRDKLEISFTGLLPAGTPRNNEVANNSIAFKGTYYENGSPVFVTLEPNATTVRSTKPTNDGEVSGQIFIDPTGTGDNKPVNTIGQNGVELEIVSNKNSDFNKKVQTTSSTDGNTKGLYTIVDLPNNAEADFQDYYMIRIADFGSPFVSSIDKGIFGTITNSTGTWITEDGTTPRKFKLTDQVGGTMKITDVDIAVEAVTPISGVVSFQNKDGDILQEYNKYAADFQVQLYDGSTKISNPAPVLEDGSYTINSKIASAKDYDIKISKKNGSKLEFVGETSISKALEPAVETTGVDFTVTDKVVPSFVKQPYIIKDTTSGNPTNIEYTFVDNETDVVKQIWTIEGPSGFTEIRGTSEEKIGAELNKITNGTIDGVFKFKVIIEDAAGNSTLSDEVGFKVLAKNGAKPVIEVKSPSKKIVEVGKDKTDKPSFTDLISDFDIEATDALGNTITEEANYVVIGLENVDFTTIKDNYDVKIKVKDLAGVWSEEKIVKYAVSDTNAPTLNIEKKNVVFANSMTNPKRPTLRDLEQSGIFGTITKDDNDKISTSENMPLESVDFENQDFTVEGNKTFEVYIKDKSANQSSKIQVTVKVMLHDVIEDGWSFEAKDIVAEQSDVNTAEKINSAAGVKVIDVKTGNEIPKSQYTISAKVNDNAVTSLRTGDYKVTFEVTRKSDGKLLTTLTREVNAQIFDVIKNGYAMRVSSSFSKQIDQVQTKENIILAAGVEVFKENNDGDFKKISNPNITVKVQGSEVTKLHSGVNQTVEFIFDDQPTVKKSSTAHIYDVMGPTYSMTAESFRANVSDVKTEQQIVNQSNATLYKTFSGEIVPGTSFTATPGSLNVGNSQSVVIKAIGYGSMGTSKTVIADIYDIYNPETKTGITADTGVDVALNGISKESIKEAANVKAFKYVDGEIKEISREDIDVSPVPTAVGNEIPVTYSANGTQLVGKTINVVDSRITINHDKVLILKESESKEITESELLTRLWATATLNGSTIELGINDNYMTSVNDAIAPSTVKIKLLAEEFKGESKGDKIESEVTIYIVEDYNPSTKIGVSAKDFKIQVKDVSLESYIEKSEIVATDFTDINDPKVIPSTPQNIKVNNPSLNKTPGSRSVKFTVTSNYSGLKAEKNVTGHVFDVVKGDIAFNHKETFEIALANLNNENLKSEAGITAWYIEDLENIEQIPNEAITVTSAPTSSGQQQDVEFSVTYKGVTETTKAKVDVVSSQIQINANKHIAVTLEEAKAMTAEKLIGSDFLNASSTLLGDTVTITVDTADVDEIKNTSTPNPTGIQVLIKALADNSDDEITTTSTVYIYDKVDQTSKIGMNMHGFTVRTSELTDAKIMEESGAVAYDLTDLPGSAPQKLDNSVITIKAGDASSKEKGDRIVQVLAMATSTRSTNMSAGVTVVDDFIGDEGINADSFSIALSELSTDRMIEKANAEQILITAPGDSSVVTNGIKVQSPETLPTTSGIYPVVFETSNGVSHLVQMTVVNTKIEMNLDRKINILLSEAKTMTKEEFISKANISANHPEFNVILDLNLDELTSLTGPTEQQINISVVATSDEITAHPDTRTETVSVRVYSAIEGQYGLNATDIISDTAGVNKKEKIIKKSELALYRLSTGEKLPVVPNNIIFSVDGSSVEQLEKGINQQVTILGTGYDYIQYTVNANVYDSYNPETGLALSSKPFVAKIDDVKTEAQVVAQGKAMVFDAATASQRPDLTVNTTNYPLTEGKKTVTYTHEKLKTTSKATIYSEYEPDKEEAINAYDFVIELEQVNEVNVKKAAKVSAFKINEDLTETPILDEDITVSTLPTTVGAHNVTFTTPNGVSVTRVANVVDKIDPVNKIAFEGH